MEGADLFWEVTLPLIFMLGAVIATLIVTLLLERNQLHKMDTKLNKLEKLDKLDQISSDVGELKRSFNDSIRAELETLSRGLVDVAKSSGKGNPYSGCNPKHSVKSKKQGKAS